MSKISAFDALTAPQGNEDVPVVVAGKNYRVNLSLLTGALGINYKGVFATVGDLPAVADSKNGDMGVVGTHFYIFRKAINDWEDAGDFVGPAGQDGIGLRILGSFTTTEDLPEEGNLSGDAYIVQAIMWVWDGIGWAAVGHQGAAGISAFEDWRRRQPDPTTVTFEDFIEVLRGPEGKRGLPGPQGNNGSDAAALRVLGEVLTIAELPKPGQPSDAWYVGDDLYVWMDNKADYEKRNLPTGPAGKDGKNGNDGNDGADGVGLPGPRGYSAYEVAQQQGFVGTEADFVRSLNGTNGKSAYELAKAKGFVGTEEDYLKSLEGKSVYQVAKDNGFTGTEPEYLASLIGPGGKSIYQLAVDNGFVGTEVEYLASIRTPDFEIGGRVNLPTELPPAGSDKAWLVAENIYLWIEGSWFDAGPFRGPRGYSPYDLAVQAGFVGTVDEWLKSLVGKSSYEIAKDQGFVGTEVEYIASLKGVKGDEGKSAYELAKEHGFVGTEADYLQSLHGTDGKDGVSLPGPRGYSAYEIAQQQGFAGDIGQWLISLIGPTGPSVYDVAVASGFVGDEAAFIASLVGGEGPQGKDGPMGPGIYILDTLANTTELPNTGEAGKGYLIDGDFWTWSPSGNNYINTGHIEGPAGKDGKNGTNGTNGKDGNKWLLYTDRDPTPVDGNLGDLCFVMATQGVWQKVANTRWAFIGNIGGGNVYDTNESIKPQARLLGRWLDIDVLEAPKDAHDYIRNQGKWERFSKYNLGVVDATGNCDVSTGNVFRLSGANGFAATLSNLPADRATVIWFSVTGRGGSVSWPQGIIWNNGQQPILGATHTNVTVTWDGKVLMGGTGWSA